MKPVYIFVFGAILVAAGVYIFLHRQNLGLFRHSNSAANGQSAPPISISWALVDRSREGFKVEMPVDTKEIEVPAYNERGTAEQVDMIYAYPDPAISFSVSWADDPPVMREVAENVDQTLEDARNGALARTQTVLVSEAQSTRQGFPVRDFIGRNQSGGIFNGRLILAAHRLYLLLVSYPAVRARRDADVNRFFDSFHIVGTAPGP